MRITKYERDFKAFKLRYLNGLKLEAIGKEVGVSTERARIIINRLKHLLFYKFVRDKKIIEFKNSLPPEVLERVRKELEEDGLLQNYHNL